MLMSAKATLMGVNITVQIQMGHMSVLVGMAIDLELIIIHVQVSQWMPHIILDVFSIKKEGNMAIPYLAICPHPDLNRSLLKYSFKVQSIYI